MVLGQSLEIEGMLGCSINPAPRRVAVAAQCKDAPGCGEWKRPTKPNPDYKGKWSAPLIDNPEYKVRGMSHGAPLGGLVGGPARGAVGWAGPGLPCEMLGWWH